MVNKYNKIELITRENKPNVIIFNGKNRIFKRGRIKKLINVRTTAPRSSVWSPPSYVKEGIIFELQNNAKNPIKNALKMVFTQKA
jgi:hypothetical protein